MIDLMVKSLIRQATQVENMGQRAAEQVKYMVVFITPEASFKTLGVEAYAELGDFISARSVDIELDIRMQPSLYINKLLPYKDDLKVQLITTDLTGRTVIEYTAIPLLDTDVRAEGNQSYHANVDGVSEGTINKYRFQLMEPIFAKMRTVEISHISLLGNMENTLSLVVDTETKKAIADTTFKYDGLIMDYPIDNDTVYKAVVVPEGIRVINLPVVLQEDERYGVYDKGLGFYFKQRRWWCYRLFDLTKYDRNPRTIDILRLPNDKAPTLQFTFFITADKLTILSTGEASQTDGTDITRQNEGTGKRLIQPSLISGETGTHYNAGRAIKTRADSMAEYATSTRKSGNDLVPLNPVPSANVYKYVSENSATDGTIINIPWHCGDPGYLEPGAAVRYMFMGDAEKMETRKGVLLGYRMDTKVIDPMTLMMKRSITLMVFLSKSTEGN